MSNQTYALEVFAPGANGDVAPVRQLSGLYGPFGVALDAKGKTYVANLGLDDPAFVVVYAAGANGYRYLRKIGGKKTKLNWSTGVFVR